MLRLSLLIPRFPSLNHLNGIRVSVDAFQIGTHVVWVFGAHVCWLVAIMKLLGKNPAGRQVPSFACYVVLLGVRCVLVINSIHVIPSQNAKNIVDFKSTTTFRINARE